MTNVVTCCEPRFHHRMKVVSQLDSLFWIVFISLNESMKVSCNQMLYCQKWTVVPTAPKILLALAIEMTVR